MAAVTANVCKYKTASGTRYRVLWVFTITKALLILSTDRNLRSKDGVTQVFLILAI